MRVFGRAGVALLFTALLSCAPSSDAPPRTDLDDATPRVSSWLWEHVAEGPDDARLVATVDGAGAAIGDDFVRWNRTWTEDGVSRSDTLTMRLPAGARVVGAEPSTGTGNRYVGSDPSAWRSGIPLFAAARWDGIVAGVDLEMRAVDARLKATWRVAPGVDPSRIAFWFEEALRVAVAPDGALEVHTRGATWRDDPPIAWQHDAAGARRPVDVAWRVRDAQIGFALGGYDARRPLWIDPGIQILLDELQDDLLEPVAGAIAAPDTSGDLLVAFSAPDGRTDGHRSSTDVLVRRVGDDGSLRWATVIGGTRDDSPYKVCGQPTSSGCAQFVDSPVGLGGEDRVSAVAPRIGPASGGAPVLAIGGTTRATDFPSTTATPYLGSNGAAVPSAQGFVATLDSQTGTLTFATTVGHTGEEAITAVALSPGGEGVFYGGWTRSGLRPNLDGTLALTTTPSRADGLVGFVAIPSTAGHAPYGTWALAVGGDGDDVVNAIDVRVSPPDAARAGAPTYELAISGSTASAALATLPPEVGAGDPAELATTLGFVLDALVPNLGVVGGGPAAPSTWAWRNAWRLFSVAPAEVTAARYHGDRLWAVGAASANGFQWQRWVGDQATALLCATPYCDANDVSCQTGVDDLTGPVGASHGAVASELALTGGCEATQFLTGDGYDQFKDLAIDGRGRVLAVGTTTTRRGSPGLGQIAHVGGTSDGLVALFDPARTVTTPDGGPLVRAPLVFVQRFGADADPPGIGGLFGDRLTAVTATLGPDPVFHFVGSTTGTLIPPAAQTDPVLPPPITLVPGGARRQGFAAHFDPDGVIPHLAIRATPTSVDALLDPLDVALTFTNHGPASLPAFDGATRGATASLSWSPAGHVSLRGTLPAGCTLTSAALVICDVPALAPAASASWTIPLRAVVAGQVTFEATPHLLDPGEMPGRFALPPTNSPLVVPIAAPKLAATFPPEWAPDLPPLTRQPAARWTPRAYSLLALDNLGEADAPILRVEIRWAPGTGATLGLHDHPGAPAGSLGICEPAPDVDGQQVIACVPPTSTLAAGQRLPLTMGPTQPLLLPMRATETVSEFPQPVKVHVFLAGHTAASPNVLVLDAQLPLTTPDVGFDGFEGGPITVQIPVEPGEDVTRTLPLRRALGAARPHHLGVSATWPEDVTVTPNGEGLTENAFSCATGADRSLVCAYIGELAQGAATTPTTRFDVHVGRDLQPGRYAIHWELTHTADAATWEGGSGYALPPLSNRRDARSVAWQLVVSPRDLSVTLATPLPPGDAGAEQVITYAIGMTGGDEAKGVIVTHALAASAGPAIEPIGMTVGGVSCPWVPAEARFACTSLELKAPSTPVEVRFRQSARGRVVHQAQVESTVHPDENASNDRRVGESVTRGTDLVMQFVPAAREGFATWPASGELFLGDVVTADVSVTKVSGPEPETWRTVIQSAVGGMARADHALFSPYEANECSVTAPPGGWVYQCTSARRFVPQGVVGQPAFQADAPGPYTVIAGAPVPDDETPTDNLVPRSGRIRGPDLGIPPQPSGEPLLVMRPHPFQAEVIQRNRVQRGAPTLTLRAAPESGLHVVDLPSATGCIWSNDEYNCPITPGVPAEGGTVPHVRAGTLTPGFGRKPLLITQRILQTVADETPTDDLRVLRFETVGPPLRLVPEQAETRIAVASGETIVRTWRLHADGDDALAKIAAFEVKADRRAGPAPRLDRVTLDAIACDGTGAARRCGETQLASGAHALLLVEATAAESGSFEIRIDVQDANNSPAGSITSGTLLVEVKPPALEVGFQVSPDPLVRAQQATATLTVTNAGPGTAKDVRVTWQIPDVAEYATHEASDGSCTASAALFDCTIAELPAGPTPWTATLTLDVLREGDKSSPVLAVHGDQTASKAARMNSPGADVRVRFDEAPGQVGDDEPTAFVLAVDNQGVAVPRDVAVTIALPPNLRIVSVSAQEANCQRFDAAGRVECALTPERPPISPEPPELIHFTVEPRTAGEGTIRATVIERGRADGPPPKQHEATHDVRTAGVDAALEIAFAPARLVPGAAGTAQIVVRNEGGRAISEVEVDVESSARGLEIAAADLDGCIAITRQLHRCTVRDLAKGAATTVGYALLTSTSFRGGTLYARARVVGDTDEVSTNDTDDEAILADLPDSDGDGVSDVEESGGPDTGDVNGDGIPDAEQGDVANTPTGGGESTGVGTTPGKLRETSSRPVGPSTGPQQRRMRVATAQTHDAPAPALPDGLYAPIGALSFVIEEIDPGTTSEVDLWLPVGAPAAGVWEYGVRPDDAVARWRPLVVDVRSPHHVRVSVTDGGVGDGDGVADGRIEVLLAPVLHAFVVDASTDLPDALLGDGLCRAADGTCTLRAAIDETNAGEVARAVVFEPIDDPFAPQRRIELTEGVPLPPVTTPLVIDARDVHLGDRPGVRVRLNDETSEWILRIEAPQSAVHALELTHRYQRASGEIATSVWALAERALITRLLAVDGYDKVRIEANRVVVRDSDLHGTDGWMLVDPSWSPSSGAAVHVLNAADVRLIGNHIVGWGMGGVFARGADRLAVIDSAFEDGYGIDLVDGADVRIAGNTFGLDENGECTRYQWTAADGSDTDGMCNQRSLGVTIEGVGAVAIGGAAPEDTNWFASGGVFVSSFDGLVEVDGNAFGIDPRGGCDPHPTLGYCRLVADYGLIAQDAEAIDWGVTAPNVVAGVSQALADLRGTTRHVEIADTRVGVPDQGMAIPRIKGVGQPIVATYTLVRVGSGATDIVIRDLDARGLDLNGARVSVDDVRSGFAAAGLLRATTQGSSLFVGHGAEAIEIERAVLCDATPPRITGASDVVLRDSWIGVDPSTGTTCEDAASYTSPELWSGLIVEGSADVLLEGNVLWGAGEALLVRKGPLAGYEARDITVRGNHFGVLPGSAPANPGTLLPTGVRGLRALGVLRLGVHDNVFAGYALRALEVDYQPSPLVYSRDLSATGNRFGEDAAGAPLPPAGTLVSAQGPTFDADDAVFVRLAPGAFGDGSAEGANRITGRRGRGVVVVGFNWPDGGGLSMRRNLMWGNGGIGIDLNDDGPAGPPGPTAANRTQKAPTLTVTGDDELQIDVALSGTTPNTTYTMDLYGLRIAHASGYGPAETWLGAVDLAIGASGAGATSLTVPRPDGVIGVSGTATAPWGTSELSAVAWPGGAPPTGPDLGVVLDEADGVRDSTWQRWVTATIAHDAGDHTVASDVTVHVVLPSGATGSDATFQVDGDDRSSDCAWVATAPPTWTCTLDQLASTEVATVSLRVEHVVAANGRIAAAVTTATLDPNPTNDTATLDLRFGDQDLRVTFTTPPPASLPLGVEASVTAAITNVGEQPADTALRVTLPPTLTLAPGGDCTPAPGGARCPLGPIPVGTSSAATFAVVGRAPGEGAVAITFDGPFTPSFPELASAQASVEVVEAVADVALALDADAAWRRGDPLVVVATVSAGGPDATGPIDLVLHDPPPWTATHLDPRCAAGATAVVCALGSLAPGAHDAVSITWLPEGRPARVAGCARALTTDPSPSNDCADLIRDGEPGNLSILAHAPRAIEIGEAATLTVTATATGDDARGVVVEVDPVGVSVDSTSLPGGCAPLGAGVRCALGDVAPDAPRTVLLPLVGTAVGPGGVEVRATQPAGDDDPSDDVAWAPIDVLEPSLCGERDIVDLAPLLGPPDASGFVPVGEGWSLAAPDATLTLAQGLALPSGVEAVEVRIRHRYAFDEHGGGTIDAGDALVLAEPGVEGPLWTGALDPATAQRALVVPLRPGPLDVTLAALTDEDATWEIDAIGLFGCLAADHADLSIQLVPPVAPLAAGEIAVVHGVVTHAGPAADTRAHVSWRVGAGLALDAVYTEDGACELTCDTDPCGAWCTGPPLTEDGTWEVEAWVRAEPGWDGYADVVADVAAFAIDPFLDDNTDAVTLAIGAAPPALRWVEVPSLVAGERGALVLAIDDPLRRDLVAIRFVGEGGDLVGVDDGTCVPDATGSTCAVRAPAEAQGAWATVVRWHAQGGPGWLDATAGAGWARADLSTLARDGAWLLGLDGDLTTPIAYAAERALTATFAHDGATLRAGVRARIAVSSNAMLTTSDPRCQRTEDALMCQLDALAPSTTAQVPFVVYGARPGLAVLTLTAWTGAPDDIGRHDETLSIGAACATDDDCDDHSPCTHGACVDGLCDQVPVNAACADPDACGASGVCVLGACVALAPCDDGLACTDDTCVDGACVNAPRGAATVCTPDSTCTLLGSCDEDALCTPLLADPCVDGDPCTGTTCDPTSGCLFEPLDLPTCPDPCEPYDDAIDCDGHVAIWRDACGVESGVLADCVVTDPCVVGTCEPGVGCVTSPSPDPDCGCTGEVAATACVEGEVHYVDPCGVSVALALACDDDDPNTADACVEPPAVCAWTAPTGTGTTCPGAWTTTCVDDESWWLDPCDRLAGPAALCTSSEPCAAATCDAGRGECVAEIRSACLAALCEPGAPVFTCDGNALVAEDACAIEVGRMSCDTVFGEGAWCDATLGACVLTPDPTALPDDVVVGGNPSRPPDEETPGRCGCGTNGTGGAPVLLLLALLARRRRVRGARAARRVGVDEERPYP